MTKRPHSPLRIAAVTIAGSYLLASCTSLPIGRRPEVSPMAMDPRVCQETETKPAIPDEAGLVEPKDTEERRAVRAYFGWVEDVMAWGERGWSRAGLARKRCGE